MTREERAIEALRRAIALLEARRVSDQVPEMAWLKAELEALRHPKDSKS
jgi:hypothetical protein